MNGPPYPPRIPLACLPTPLEPLPRLSAALHVRVSIKRDDCTGAVETGNKVRKLEFLAARAQAEGCDTLITCGGVQSNHCRATAAVGARLGFRVVLVLRGTVPAEPSGRGHELFDLRGREVLPGPTLAVRDPAWRGGVNFPVYGASGLAGHGP